MDFEIILIDNGSLDGSYAKFQSEFSQNKRIVIVESLINLGFGAGNNLGASYAKGDHLFFLNNDTIFFEDSPSILLQEYLNLNTHSAICFIQPRLYLNRTKTRVQRTSTRLPKLFNLFQENIPFLQAIQKDSYNNFSYSNWNRDSSREVGVVCGAAMFCSKEKFFEVGRFDDKYFLYFEEYDICGRAFQKGYTNYFTTRTSIVHLHNQSPNPSLNKRLIYISSFLRYVKNTII